jgi:hypothetical protein
MCEAAIFLAEDIWLNATTPADLAQQFARSIT